MRILSASCVRAGRWRSKVNTVFWFVDRRHQLFVSDDYGVANSEAQQKIRALQERIHRNRGANSFACAPV